MNKLQRAADRANAEAIIRQLGHQLSYVEALVMNTPTSPARATLMDSAVYLREAIEKLKETV